MNISDSTPISETNVNQVFHLLDADRDGFVSCEEFVNALKMYEIELQEHGTIWDDQALTDVAKVKMMQVVIECRHLSKSTWLEDEEL
jgi:Ca2+-binding EF-hand superfamily protein